MVCKMRPSEKVNRWKSAAKDVLWPSLPRKKKIDQDLMLNINVNGGTVSNPVLPFKEIECDDGTFIYPRKMFNHLMTDVLKYFYFEKDFTGKIIMHLSYCLPSGYFEIIRKEK